MLFYHWPLGAAVYQYAEPPFRIGFYNVLQHAHIFILRNFHELKLYAERQRLLSPFYTEAV